MHYYISPAYAELIIIPEYQNPLLILLTARLYTIRPPKRKPVIPPGTYDTKKLSSAAICTIADNKVRILECNYR